MSAVVAANVDPGLAAAVGALLIAVLNELRARSRARTAALERETYRAELKQIVEGDARGSEMDGGSPASR